MREEFSWLDVPVEEGARALLGSTIIRELDGEVLAARIVETEAYDQNDPASHTFRGPTARNAAMFKEAGHAYVYLIHGIHHCLNLVAGKEGFGQGILVRAVEPITGIETMEARRGGRTGVHATNGPGKVCQAMGIDLSLTGHDVALPPLRLQRGPALADEDIVVGPRIGISKGLDLPRRFYERGNPYVSKPWVK